GLRQARPSRNRSDLHRPVSGVRLDHWFAASLAIAVPRASLASAQGPALSVAAVRGVRDRSELESFVDGMMGSALVEHHIAGAVVAVVKDGALLFEKGYGFADVERRLPVDPERTLFRIGSVTKLFTATAVMQLVEQGK